MAYRLASDAPLSWVTQRTLRNQRHVSERLVSRHRANNDDVTKASMDSLSPRGLPLAPQGPAFQGLQVYPETSQRVNLASQRHICAATNLTVLSSAKEWRELTFCPDGPRGPTGPLGPGGPVWQTERFIVAPRASTI